MIAIADYGMGNLRSVEKAFQFLGHEAFITDDPQRARGASHLVLPGDAAFGDAMRNLRTAGWDTAIEDHVSTGRPFLGICVGLQLLFEGSEESPGREGLGVLGGTVAMLPGDVKRPQMQWNRLDAAERRHPLLDGIADDAWVYFVHGYAAPVGPNTVATCEYGSTVCAAVASGTLWATQFHPEKSGGTGLRVLQNFVDRLAA